MSLTKQLCRWFQDVWLGKICFAENLAPNFTEWFMSTHSSVSTVATGYWFSTLLNALSCGEEKLWVCRCYECEWIKLFSARSTGLARITTTGIPAKRAGPPTMYSNRWKTLLFIYRPSEPAPCNRPVICVYRLAEKLENNLSAEGDYLLSYLAWPTFGENGQLDRVS